MSIFNLYAISFKATNLFLVIYGVISLWVGASLHEHYQFELFSNYMSVMAPTVLLMIHGCALVGFAILGLYGVFSRTPGMLRLYAIAAACIVGIELYYVTVLYTSEDTIIKMLIKVVLDSSYSQIVSVILGCIFSTGECILSVPEAIHKIKIATTIIICISWGFQIICGSSAVALSNVKTQREVEEYTALRSTETSSYGTGKNEFGC